MVHLDSCPLCSAVNLKEKFICTDHFVSKEKFPVVRCENCGFTFTQNHPDEADAAKYYESQEYISHSDTAQGLTNKLYRLARKFMLWKKARLVKKVTGISSGKILDIGSGTGYFAHTMKDEGWRSEGVEINEKARDYSKSEFGIDVFDPKELKELRPGGYDCITLWHVLEHFHNPDNYMKEIARLLKTGGICVVALPNSNSYDASYYRQFWGAWDVPRHLWHFTPVTFKKYCEMSMFELINIKTLPLDVFYVSILSEKYKGSKFHFISGMIRGLRFFLQSIFNKERSSSLIYVLRVK